MMSPSYRQGSRPSLARFNLQHALRSGSCSAAVAAPGLARPLSLLASHASAAQRRVDPAHCILWLCSYPLKSLVSWYRHSGSSNPWDAVTGKHLRPEIFITCGRHRSLSSRRGGKGCHDVIT
ncbi:hypothetical protein LZ31DRAFT_325800 [Colletotrichum somersetense]|nr:hypothetical protein LZ31DRAFT_325800 [Colletotrichum somersetense]